MGNLSQRITARALGLTIYLTWAMLFSGCAELEILPSWVPFQGPASDSMPGVTPPAERIAQFKKLSEQANSCDAEQRLKISEQLAAAIRQETDPLIRVEIIRTLGRYPGPAANRILQTALSDADPQVRIAACEAWGRRSDPKAVELLAETLRGDVNIDVRLAAAKALGETRHPGAVAPLGEALDDADPALQYRAVLALQKATGKNLGVDVYRWRQYVRGELKETTPSLAERIFHWF